MILCDGSGVSSIKTFGPGSGKNFIHRTFRPLAAVWVNDAYLEPSLARFVGLGYRALGLRAKCPLLPKPDVETLSRERPLNPQHQTKRAYAADVRF